MNDKPGKCDEKYINIKFNSDDNLPLNKILELHNLTVVVRSFFKEDYKFKCAISGIQLDYKKNNQKCNHC